MNTELVIMAAGMGSRYGGLKQAAPLGPNGELIIDYSVYDAAEAGFDRAVIIIRHDIEHDFREACGKRIEKRIDTEYVFQEPDSHLLGYTTPSTREKPWGTGQAILCAGEKVKNPFLVINADDYYGKSVYKMMYDYLKDNSGMCMAGYRLGNTLSDNGEVTRGVCETENGYLTKVTECYNIAKDTDIPHDTVVSMNMWGLDTGIFDYLEKDFKKFLDENINEPKKEFCLPTIIDKRIREENKKVRVLETDEKWYGVTYIEDAPVVKQALKTLTDKGLYK